MFVFIYLVFSSNPQPFSIILADSMRQTFVAFFNSFLDFSILKQINVSANSCPFWQQQQQQRRQGRCVEGNRQWKDAQTDTY